VTDNGNAERVAHVSSASTTLAGPPGLSESAPAQAEIEGHAQPTASRHGAPSRVVGTGVLIFARSALIRPASGPNADGADRSPRTVGVMVWAGLALSLGWLAYMLGPGLASGFQIYDDHEIIDIVGRHSRLPVSRIPHDIVSRSWERNGRFRPVFWVGRVIESATAGRNPHIWFADRFVLAAIAVIAVYFIAIRFIGPLPAALVSLLPFSGLQLDTWIRLGSNEVYAFPLALVGLWVIVARLPKVRSLLGIWPGYVLLALSALAKENFLLVSACAIGVTAWYAKRRGLSRSDWYALAAASTVALINLAILLAIVKRYGTVYQQTRSLSALDSWTRYAYSSAEKYQWVVPATIMFVLLSIALRPFRDGVRGIALMAGAITAIVLPQLLFYTGSPELARYFYPLVLGSVLIWAGSLWLAASFTAHDVGPKVTVVLLVALLIPLYQGTSYARKEGSTVALYSRVFKQGLAKTVADAGHHDTRVIVLQPDDATTDIERVLSLARFLTVEDGLTVMTLPAARTPTAVSAPYARTLASWSEAGTGDLTPYSPPANGNCVSIMFAKSVPVCRTTEIPPG
jgi:hypothetical protein